VKHEQVESELDEAEQLRKMIRAAIINGPIVGQPR
jgi:hypothetical protein